MSCERCVIEVEGLGKCYEVYPSPRARLKQALLPGLWQAGNRLGAALGIVARQPAPAYFREFWALQDISLRLEPGRTLGIIGRNGSGKSTLLQILAGTLAPSLGRVRVEGRVAALLELGSGFNPEYSGRDNVFLNGHILGLSRAEIEARYERIVAFADIGEFIDQPVKNYSSGMLVRLAFAVQAHIDASIMIIDEALAVGDVFFTQKCYARLRELVDSGAAVIFVSHDMTTVTQFCDEVIVLDRGRELFRGEPVPAIRRFMALESEVASALRQRARATTALVADEVPQASPPPAWPSSLLPLDTSAADVVGNGQAEFLGVAVSDVQGVPTRYFETGEVALFHFAFRILDDIGVPVGGLSLVNEKNIIVHGKNSLQLGAQAPDVPQAGQILEIRQKVTLALTPGEYSFVIGLAGLPAEIHRQAGSLSHEELAKRLQRIVSVGNAGTLTVGFRQTGLALPHHGLADLPGESCLTLAGATLEVVAND